MPSTIKPYRQPRRSTRHIYVRPLCYLLASLALVAWGGNPAHAEEVLTGKPLLSLSSYTHQLILGSPELRAALSSPGILKNDTTVTDLHALLSSTQTPELLPDTDYTRIQAVVSGNANPSEQFSDVLVTFLTDPLFSCRRPAQDRYFRTRYHLPPAAVTCNSQLPFLVFQRYGYPELQYLDSERVAEIRLLFGGTGTSLASRFGHVALHLVVCPEGKRDATSCNSNLFEHLVLGFMAHIDEFELSSLKALLGDYRAYLFASRFIDVYQDYAIHEFREVYSLPLKLNKSEKHQLLTDFTQIHWEFSGNYHFFSNNCASLLYRALVTSLPAIRQAPGLHDGFVRPDRLFEAFRKSSITEGSLLEPRGRAEQNGYYFSSTEPYYQKAFTAIKGTRTHYPFRSLAAYLDCSSICRRQVWLSDPQFFEQLQKDPYLMGAQQLLEELALVRSERHFFAQGSRYLQNLNIIPRKQELLGKLSQEQSAVFQECLLAPLAKHLEPIPRRVGIPEQLLEKREPVSQSRACQTPEQKKILTDILRLLEDGTQTEWKKLIAASEEVEATLQNLRALKELHAPYRSITTRESSK